MNISTINVLIRQLEKFKHAAKPGYGEAINDKQTPIFHDIQVHVAEMEALLLSLKETNNSLAAKVISWFNLRLATLPELRDAIKVSATEKSFTLNLNAGQALGLNLAAAAPTWNPVSPEDSDKYQKWVREANAFTTKEWLNESQFNSLLTLPSLQPHYFHPGGYLELEFKFLKRLGSNEQVMNEIFETVIQALSLYLTTSKERMIHG